MNLLTGGRAPQEFLVCVKISLGLLAVDWRLISPFKVLTINQKLLLDVEYCFL